MDGDGDGMDGDGKNAKSLEEDGKTDTPLSNLRSVSARGAGCVYRGGVPTLRVSHKNS